MHLVSFIIRIYHDARSPERQSTFIYIFIDGVGNVQGKVTIHNVNYGEVSLAACSNPQAGNTLPVSCPPVATEYIRSYPRDLQAAQ